MLPVVSKLAPGINFPVKLLRNFLYDLQKAILTKTLIVLTEPLGSLEILLKFLLFDCPIKRRLLGLEHSFLVGSKFGQLPLGYIAVFEETAHGIADHEKFLLKLRFGGHPRARGAERMCGVRARLGAMGVAIGMAISKRA